MSLDRDQADKMVEQLKTLAQPQRLMILATLLGGERAVGEIEVATGIGQPALSQQLAELRRADLVATRREARQIFYSIASEVVEDRIHVLFAALGAAVPDRKVPVAAVPPVPNRVFTGAATFARIG
jgi:DNA-binding transcriptional ArsR family regulator